MPPPLIGGGIKRCFCLTSVCLSRTSGLSREQRPRKTKIGIEIAHVTRDSDTTFTVKGQGHQVVLLSAALTRKAAAAVSVGTYSAWESTATLRLFGGARGSREPTGEERGGAYCVGMLTACFKKPQWYFVCYPLYDAYDFTSLLHTGIVCF